MTNPIDLERALAERTAELAEALEQQTATGEVLRVISSSMADASPVFEKILDSCARVVALQASVMWLLRDDDCIHRAASRGLTAEQIARYQPLPLNESVTGQALSAGHPIHYPLINKSHPAWKFASTVRVGLDAMGEYSMLTVPLMWEGRGLGSIILVRYPPKPFTDKEISLMRTFADQAVIALENARLMRETREALEQQTASAEILRVISESPSDIQPVLHTITRASLRLVAGTQAGIMLCEQEGFRFMSRARADGTVDGPFDTIIPLDPHANFPSQVICCKKLIHIPDWEAIDVPPFERRIFEQQGFRAMLGVPIMRGERCIGTLGIMRHTAGAFSDKEINLMQVFVRQAEIAIENVRLFHEIHDKNRQLATANQHKSDFLANMSHELRTPLNAIIGFSEVLLERMFGELNDKQVDYLKDIHGSGKHLLSLINDILDLSKIEAGRMELELSEFDIPAALGNALTLVRERATRHGIELKLEIAPGVGARRADERKFKQILLNLLSNAVKFTPDGGRVTVRAALLEDATLEVAIDDSGIGIAAADQAAVFEEFRQVGRHYTNKNEGTGLGLALCKRFVELHGGVLRLESTPGAGATFTFTLPELSL